jgi:hypothetical protein
MGRSNKAAPKKAAPKQQNAIMQFAEQHATPRMKHFEEEVGQEIILPGCLWYSKGAQRNRDYRGKVVQYEKDHIFGGVPDHGFAFECDGTISWFVWHVYNTEKWIWLKKPENKQLYKAEMTRQETITSSCHAEHGPASTINSVCVCR